VGPIRVRAAAADDVAAASAVLADAFADYTWTRWTVASDGHRDRIEALQRLVIEQIAMPYGEVWLAEDERGVASVAIWMLPTSSVPPQVREATAALQAELEGDRHDASLAAEAACVPLRPAPPHYYLGAVGTRSDRRREGLGRAVLEPMLGRAQADGVTVCVETSDRANVAFYERLRFSVTGEIDVPGGGPHVWAMARGLHAG
jgi:ribosomal protein S18 acetylase RimI-like enzyme